MFDKVWGEISANRKEGAQSDRGHWAQTYCALSPNGGDWMFSDIILTAPTIFPSTQHCGKDSSSNWARKRNKKSSQWKESNKLSSEMRGQYNHLCRKAYKLHESYEI